MRYETFDPRWFGIEENNGKYRFILFSPKNKQQAMGYSEWMESKELSEKLMYEFIRVVRHDNYKTEIRSTIDKPVKYLCTFLDENEKCLIIATGYPSKKLAQSRERRICEAVEKSKSFI